MLRANPDTNPRPPHDSVPIEAAIFDEQTIAGKINAVLGERDPHRHGQIARAAAEFFVAEDRRSGAPAAFHRTGTTPAHHLDTFEGRQRPHEHRGRRTLRFGHNVDETVNAVIQVDVSMAGRAVQRLIPSRRTRRRVARRIRFADIRFDLHNDAAGANAATLVHKDFADQIPRHVKGRTVVKRVRELRRHNVERRDR